MEASVLSAPAGRRLGSRSPRGGPRALSQAARGRKTEQAARFGLIMLLPLLVLSLAFLGDVSCI